jgi:hypothetical protein
MEAARSVPLLSQLGDRPADAPVDVITNPASPTTTATAAPPSIERFRVMSFFLPPIPAAGNNMKRIVLKDDGLYCFGRSFGDLGTGNDKFRQRSGNAEERLGPQTHALGRTAQTTATSPSGCRQN